MKYRIPPKIAREFLSYIEEVMEFGATKHGDMNWTQVDGTKSSHKEMHDSMFHHLAESFTNNRQDSETGCDPLQHLATRAVMTLWRKKRGLI